MEAAQIEWQALLRAIVALFVVVDPIGNVPIFIGLTKNLSPAQRSRAFRSAVIVSAILLLIFAFAGQLLLTLFGISIHSFKIAGGLLLLILAMKILISGSWEEKTVTPEGAGAVPMAFPLLAGPGAITTTIVMLQITGFVEVILAVLSVIFITSVVLIFIERIYIILGETGSSVAARLMAVFIAAIAFQFIIEGIRFYFT
ncbi:MAG: MarC family protein [Nitrososphaerales archaeon]